jgi:hypothetical protein
LNYFTYYVIIPKSESGELSVSKLEYLKNPIDAVRTAPVGFAAATIGVGILAAAYGFYANSEPGTVEGNLGRTTSIVSACAGAYALKYGRSNISGQYDLRERYERIMQNEVDHDRDAFNERAMSTAMHFWCDRQTAKIASETFNVTDAWSTMVEQHRLTGNVRLANVPHI